MWICEGKILGLIELISVFFKIFKYAIPLIIIVYGMFDFYKALISDKAEDMKKHSKRFIYRVIAGLIIFFIPTIIFYIFNIYGVSNNKCVACFLDSSKCVINENADGESNNSQSNAIDNKECTIFNEECISKAIFYEN